MRLLLLIRTGASLAPIPASGNWYFRRTPITGVRNGTYRDAVTGHQLTVSNGTISFTVKGYSAGIYVLNGPGKIGSDGEFLR